MTVIESNEAMAKLQGFIEAAMQAVTAEMVNEIAIKVVSMIEVADDVIQPETLELLRKLPEVSENLARTLDKLKAMEENGTLNTLFQLSEMVGSMKQSITGPMVSDMMEKAISGVELADDLMQKGTLELVDGMVTAFDNAKQERKGKEPLSIFQIVQSLSERQTREGLSLLLSFVKALPKELK